MIAGSTMPYYLVGGKQCTCFGIGCKCRSALCHRALSIGVSYRSPVWFQNFTWNREDLTGVPTRMNFQMDLPQVVSMGAGITATRAR